MVQVAVQGQPGVSPCGRAAEEIIFQEVTTGASNDIERVTEMARQMVTRYGMSQKLGLVALGRKEELVFLGREISEQRNYSDQIALEIDQEVRALVDEAYATAKEILTPTGELHEISECYRALDVDAVYLRGAVRGMLELTEWSTRPSFSA